MCGFNFAYFELYMLRSSEAMVLFTVQEFLTPPVTNLRLPLHSAGWVAYSVSTVVSAVGENRLMPVTDCPCKVISSESGYVRDNASWIIGRMVRDFDYWMERGPSRNPDGHKIRQRMEEVLDKKWTKLKEIKKE